MDPRYVTHPNFDKSRPQAGDFISAAEFRKLKAYVQELSTRILAYETNPPLQVIKLLESIGPEFNDSSSDWRGRDGTIRYWDATAGLWRDTNPANSPSNVTDAIDVPWDKGDCVVAFYHRQGHQYVPINARTVRAVMTVPEDSGYYPPENSVPAPNVFPIKFVGLSYTRASGKQSLSVTYLDSDGGSPAEPGPDDYVMNVFESDSDEETYLPPYTIIFAWNQNNRWFTYSCCNVEQSSASSVSASSVSSASESSSLSSSGVSSLSSGGSSASSGGSSMSSGGSSGSSGGSSASSGGVSSETSGGLSSGGFSSSGGLSSDTTCANYPCAGSCAFEFHEGGELTCSAPGEPSVYGYWTALGNPYGCGPAEECTCPKTPGGNLFCTAANYEGEIVTFACVDIDCV